MKILATFVNFTYDSDLIELAHAWDEYTVDANYRGYVEERQERLDAYGKDLAQVVDAVIEVDMAEIYARFDPTVTTGVVSVAGAPQ